MEKSKNSKERTNVCFSWNKDLVDMLKAKSKESHIPQSVLVSLALSEYLNKKEKE